MSAGAGGPIPGVNMGAITSQQGFKAGGSAAWYDLVARFAGYQNQGMTIQSAAPLGPNGQFKPPSCAALATWTPSPLGLKGSPPKMDPTPVNPNQIFAGQGVGGDMAMSTPSKSR